MSLPPLKKRHSGRGKETAISSTSGNREFLSLELKSENPGGFPIQSQGQLKDGNGLGKMQAL